MRSKRILLISDDRADADAAREALTALQIPFALDIADSGEHALDYLMGRSSARMENYVRTGKVQPDLVLMSCLISDMEYSELLSIMRKYYSLQSIPVLLLCEGDAIIPDTLATSLGVAGFIPRARQDGKIIFEPTRMKPILAGGGSVLSVFSIDWLREISARTVGAIAKAKTVIAPVGSAVTAKVCSISGGIAICSAVTFTAVGHSDVAETKTRLSIATETAETSQVIPPAVEPVPVEAVMPEQEQAQPESPVAERKAKTVRTQQKPHKAPPAETLSTSAEVTVHQAIQPEPRKFVIRVVPDDEQQADSHD